LGFGLGAGLIGWGLSSWGLGTWPYAYGYSSYANPYYMASPGVMVDPIYNYSQPIAVDSVAPAQTAVDSGATSFDAARASFKAGDNAQALQLVEQALTSLPNDVDLHEFRAIVLFALGRYDEASGAIYAVLTAGPGWNWATLISLYPNVDAFTAQLRALEGYRRDHPDQASPRFLLAYLYTAMGSTDAAVAELRKVVQLKPNDKLSAQLLTELANASQSGDTPPANPQPVSTTPPPSNLTGTWKASGADGAAITLAFQTDGKFTWTAVVQGKTRSFSGQYTAGNGLLTLAREDGQAIVGKISGAGDNGFHFALAGGGAGDPGLTFQH
jgi:tetratricopeptide (TPR) repeat protein